MQSRAKDERNDQRKVCGFSTDLSFSNSIADFSHRFSKEIIRLADELVDVLFRCCGRPLPNKSDIEVRYVSFSLRSEDHLFEPSSVDTCRLAAMVDGIYAYLVKYIGVE